MIQYTYVALRDAIKNAHMNLNYVDWYLGQDKPNKSGSDPIIHTSPACFIHFLPTKHRDLSSNVQSSDITFEVILMSETAFGDENDVLNTQIIDHLNIESAIYKAIQGQSYNAATTDLPLIQSISRVKTNHHNRQGRFVRSSMLFTANVNDITATDDPSVNLTEVIATLDLQVQMCLPMNLPVVDETLNKVVDFSIATTVDGVQVMDNSIFFDNTYTRLWQFRNAGDDAWTDLIDTNSTISILGFEEKEIRLTREKDGLFWARSKNYS